MAKKSPTQRKPRLPAVKVREFKQIQRLLARVTNSFAHCEHEAGPMLTFLEDLFLIGYGAGAWASRRAYDPGWRPRKAHMPPPEEVKEILLDLEWTLRSVRHDVPKSHLN